jgi:hypothetical protein
MENSPWWPEKACLEERFFCDAELVRKRSGSPQSRALVFSPLQSIRAIMSA